MIPEIKKRKTFDENATKKDIYLDEYQKQLKLDTAKAQSEITSANKLANQYMQNYLKQQGLVGTGIGQSQYTNLATNYANTMAQLRADEANKLRQEAETYQTNKTKELGELLSTMNQTEREKYLSEIQQTEGLDQKYLDALNSQSIALTNQEKQQKTQSQKELIATMIENNGDVAEITNRINMLKNQGVDVSDLESLQEMSGQTIEKLAKQLYTTMKTKQSSFTGNNELYNNALNNLQKAISSNDSFSIVKAYQEAFDLLQGFETIEPNEPISNNGQVNDIEGQNKAMEYIDKRLKGNIYDNGVSLSQIMTAYPQLNNLNIDVQNSAIRGNEKRFLYDGTDDDFDIDISCKGRKGKNYDLDVDWTYGGNQGTTKANWEKATKYLTENFSTDKDQLVLYDNRVWFYSTKTKQWGIVQNNTGGKKLYNDLSEALEGKIPSRWESN